MSKHQPCSHRVCPLNPQAGAVEDANVRGLFRLRCSWTISRQPEDQEQGHRGARKHWAGRAQLLWQRTNKFLEKRGLFLPARAQQGTKKQRGAFLSPQGASREGWQPPRKPVGTEDTPTVSHVAAAGDTRESESVLPCAWKQHSFCYCVPKPPALPWSHLMSSLGPCSGSSQTRTEMDTHTHSQLCTGAECFGWPRAKEVETEADGFIKWRIMSMPTNHRGTSPLAVDSWRGKKSKPIKIQQGKHLKPKTQTPSQTQINHHVLV